MPAGVAIVASSRHRVEEGASSSMTAATALPSRSSLPNSSPSDVSDDLSPLSGSSSPDLSPGSPEPHLPLKKQRKDTRSSRVSAKRAEQNRQAQKAFRERRQRYLKELEQQLEQANQQLKMVKTIVRENEDLKRQLNVLQTENTTLRSEPVVKEEQVTVEDLFFGYKPTQDVLDFSFPLVKDPFSFRDPNVKSVPQETPPPPILFADDDTLNSFNPAVTHKQNLENIDGLSEPVLPPLVGLPKDSDGKDYQTELCELLHKTHCKESNPEICQGRKFKKNL